MKKITLSIPEPCHENWNSMSPTHQGRFCGSCQKEVIDFTTMTDDELFRFFADKTKQSVCGRTLPYQLNTPLAKPVEHKKKKFWYISYLTSLLLFFSKQEVRAQVKPQVTTTPVAKPTETRLGRMTRLPVKEEVKEGFVTGKVTDDKGNPVPYATVIVSGTKIGTAADEQGNFNIRAKTGDVFKISCVGFETKMVTLSNTGFQTIVLSSATMDGMLMVAVGGISACSSDDYVAPEQPRHIAQLYVKDNGNNDPVANAQLTIIRNNQDKQKKRYTSSKGFYELRNIKESDSYTITVSAMGYKEQSLIINGTDFNKRKMDRIILLEKQELKKLVQEIAVTAEIQKSTQPVTLPDAANALTGRVGGVQVFHETRITKPSLLSSLLRPLFSSSPKKPAEQAKTATITAYPNPVTLGGSVTITTANLAEGDYTLFITTIAGEKLYSTRVQLAKAGASFTINTVHVKKPGIYVIEMISESGNKAAGKLLIQ
jgi:azurin